MFFPDRITAIRQTDRVLEIGPGADPHPRSDVLLEMAFNDPADYAKQFGHTGKLITTKPVVFYDGTSFPFADHEFDYVICSHVLEHVPDPEAFVAEIFRVGRRGYFEYPLAYYEYLYNFEVHLNLVKYTGGTLRYMKKSDTHLDDFAPLQTFFLRTLEQGHSRLIDDLNTHFIEGFQWEAPFIVERTRRVADICPPVVSVPAAPSRGLHTHGPVALAKAFLRSLLPGTRS